MDSSAQPNERYLWTQRPAPGHILLEKYVETEFRPQDRLQAALAFATAEKLRAQQRRLLKEQAEFLEKANVCGAAAASLEQFIVAQELIAVDLRARRSPGYGMPQRREVEKFHVKLNMPSEMLRFAVPPIEDILSTNAECQGAPEKENDLGPAGMAPSVTLPVGPSSASTLPSSVSTLPCSQFVSTKPDVVVPPTEPIQSVRVPEQPTVAAKSVETGSPVEANQDPTPRKSVGWNERSVSKKVLGRTPRPYPSGLKINKFLIDGAPAFEFREIFGILPEQVELVLEMDSTHRFGVPTRFILDPTVDYNVIQLKTVDERVGPSNQDGVKPRPVKETYVSWSSLNAVRVEWHTERMLLRRWSDSEMERNQSMEVPIQASVTNSRSIPVNVQILGLPFAKQYVRSFVLFGDDDGAIAVVRDQRVEWWPFKSAAACLQ